MNKMDKITEIKDLITKICQLSQQEKQHILKFLIANNIIFTKNINGYFFNLASNNVSEQLLNELKTKIHLMELHRNEIINVDTLRDNMIKQCKELIETNLQDSIKIKLDEYNHKIKLINENYNINMTINKCITITKNKYNDKYNDKYSDKYNDNLNIKKNYNKNSIYYRILSKMKTISSKKKDKIHENYNDDEDYNNENIDSIDCENLENVDNGDTYIDDTIVIDDELDDDDENDYGDNDTYDSESELENKIQIENEKSYYKKLLNNHGFKFDNDKSCLLIYQEYII